MEKSLALGIIKLWKKLDDYRLSDCKLAILDCASKIRGLNFIRFLCSTNAPTYQSLSSLHRVTLPEVVTLVVTSEEVILVDTESSEEIDCIGFPFIMRWGYHEQGITFIASKELSEITLHFDTKQGAMIDFLLKGYSRILGKKDMRGLTNRKAEKGFVSYKTRSSLEYIEKQRAGYELRYDLV